MTLAIRKLLFKRNPFSRDKPALTDFSLKSRFYCESWAIEKKLLCVLTVLSVGDISATLNLEIPMQIRDSSDPTYCRSAASTILLVDFDLKQYALLTVCNLMNL